MTSDQISSSARGPDIILIDDDPLVRDTWAMVARRHGHRLLALSNLQGFPDEVTRNTLIFVDYHLARPDSGRDAAESLLNQGFTEVYFCTGSAPSDLDLPKNIRGVIGKEYPAELLSKSRR